MPKLVQSQLIPIEVDSDPGNVIWIREQLDLGQSQRLQNSATAGVLGHTSDRGIVSGLWEIYVVKWAGPDFDGLPCTAKNWNKYSPDDPLIEAVDDAIEKQYRAQFGAKEDAEEQAAEDRAHRKN